MFLNRQMLVGILLGFAVGVGLAFTLGRRPADTPSPPAPTLSASEGMLPPPKISPERLAPLPSQIIPRGSPFQAPEAGTPGP